MDTLRSPARLADVRRSGLLDTGPEEPFDRLTRLARELLDAPSGFVTVVDERRSFWKSCIGVDATSLDDRQNSVDESFCQYVIASDGPIIIDDSRLDPMTWNNPSIESMGVIAWAGYPVRSPDGHVLGTFCVVDSRPRRWSDQDKRTLEALAQAAGGEVGLRIAADEARATAHRYRRLADALGETLLPRRLPTIDGLDVAAARRLTGDGVFGGFYDTVQTPTGWAVFLGEADSARAAALAKHSARAAAQRATSPVIALTEVHAGLRQWAGETGEEAGVAVTYLALRPAAEGFAARLSTAGTPQARVHREDGTIERIGQPGDSLRSGARPIVRVDDFTLVPGDTVVLLLDEPDGVAPTVIRRACLDADASRTSAAMLDAGSAADTAIVTVRIPLG